MLIQANGNVGIGTTSPSSKLEVKGGAITIRNGGDGLIHTDETTTTGTYVDATAGQIGTNTNHPLWLYTNYSGTPAIAILTNNNVGIGTTAPAERLHIIGNGLFSGSVTASCGVLICSDLRYKKTITPLTGSLEKVSKLNGVNYYFRSDEFPELNFSDDKQIGLIVQDVEKIFPELVKTDEKGNKSVDYSKLTPILVEAIKELKAQNKRLTLENTSVKNSLGNIQTQIQSLEAKINLLVNVPVTEINK